jgi:uncharacterized protein YbjQ (UPF0145 family)
MRISSGEIIDGSRILYPIGRITAASSWHGASLASRSADWQERALDALIQKAQDCEADAIIGLEYEVDSVDAGDIPGAAPLRRVAATGIAVKLARS